MPDWNWNAIVDILTLALLALGGYGLVLLKAGTEAAVKTSAEEAAKATIQQLRWPAELARELQKTRGVERQELRFKGYGALWKELRPLAIYDATVIDRKVVGDLSSKLSDWYFTEYGGLMLTPQARDFYFALQDLLRAASSAPEDWDADRAGESEGSQKRTVRAVLTARGAGSAVDVLDYISVGSFADWEDRAAGLAKAWRDGINVVAGAWKELDRKERFAVLQQVGSILRTSLVNDLESRVR
jgi:hypothetical protein